jgi:hypothetical protein
LGGRVSRTNEAETDRTGLRARFVPAQPRPKDDEEEEEEEKRGRRKAASAALWAAEEGRRPR